MAVVFSLGLTTVAMEAEAAKRMGSGKSMGTQRQATPDKARPQPRQQRHQLRVLRPPRLRAPGWARWPVSPQDWDWRLWLPTSGLGRSWPLC
jgi:hypothetical protein